MRRGKSYRLPMPQDITPHEAQEPVFKQCTIKRPFTEEEAQEIVERAGHSKGGWQRLNYYKCKYCPLYHCTSRRKPEQRLAVRRTHKDTNLVSEGE